MKLKNIFLTIAACLAFVSCDEEFVIPTMDELQLSNTYVSINKDGGSATIELTAADSWSIDATQIPEWLTISPISGGAGAATVSFSAEATTKTRKVSDLIITVGEKSQYINVEQSIGIVPVSNATCAEVIAGADGKTYRVAGAVTSIANTTYGNWYLADETGEIYIYGTVDATGAYNWSSFGIEVGDVVTVEGPKTTYNGTVELVDVTVVNVEKSLIAAVDKEVTATKEGGVVDVRMICKSGYGVNFNIPDDYKSWITVQSISAGAGDTTIVSLNVAANEAGARNATLEFTTTASGKVYSTQVALAQEGSILEVSVAEFLAAAEDATVYRITGVVTSIVRDDRGRFNIKDYSGEVYVYNLYDENGSYVSLSSLGIEVGDIVTVLGNRGSYGTTIEALNSTFEKKIDVTEISIADFLTKEDSKDVYYKVTGTISSIANTTYGNLNITDGTNTLYVYGCYPGYGATGDNRKNFLATAGINVGDELTMIGYKDTYNGTIELCGGTYFSHTPAQN